MYVHFSQSHEQVPLEYHTSRLRRMCSRYDSRSRESERRRMLMGPREACTKLSAQPPNHNTQEIKSLLWFRV